MSVFINKKVFYIPIITNRYKKFYFFIVKMLFRELSILVISIIDIIVFLFIIKILPHTHALFPSLILIIIIINIKIRILN